jgi:succinate-acetate transporter protein
MDNIQAEQQEMAPSIRKEDPEAQTNGYDSSSDTTRFRQFANPAPLGLCGFALTTFVLSLINVHARHVAVPNIIIGLGTSASPILLTEALAYGGLAQFMAGMWEFTTGNVFGVVAFTSYGAFWISFATLFIPFFGIADAYTAADPTEVEFLNAIGHYLLGIGLLL